MGKPVLRGSTETTRSTSTAVLWALSGIDILQKTIIVEAIRTFYWIIDAPRGKFIRQGGSMDLVANGETEMSSNKIT